MQIRISEPLGVIPMTTVDNEVEQEVNFEGRLYKWLCNPIVPFQHGLMSCFQRGPCLIIRASDCSEFSETTLYDLINDWLCYDDVVCNSFCRTIWFVQNIGGDKQAQNCASWFQNIPLHKFQHLSKLGVSTIYQLSIDNNVYKSQAFCSGPYLLTDVGFHWVYRLYEDTQSALFSSIIQSPMTGCFLETRPTTQIAVPSRLYYPPPSPQRPFSGLRFVTKDVIDLASLRTSAGSRAYYRLSQQSESSAQLVEDLLQLGAVLVGKSKNTQFANGEEPREWVDYDCPWNPRGDGYQNPDTSSSGSATAVASYSYIDFAIGTDTCGSVTCPASAQGLFAIRFSTGIVPGGGVFQLSKYLDSVGFFTRSIDRLSFITERWLGKSCEGNSDMPRSFMPKHIVYPWSSFPHHDEKTLEAHENLIKALMDFTGATRRDIDLDKEWRISDPLGTGLSIYEDLKETTTNLHLAGFLDAILPFTEKYKEAFREEPYLDRVNQERMKLAVSKVTPETRNSMLWQKEAFSKFFREKIMPWPNEDSGGQRTIMLWPSNPQEPQYRDNYPPVSPGLRWRWDIDFTAPLAGLPQAIIPIGQYEYESRITGTTEFLPIAASIVGPVGGDAALAHFIDRFLHSSKGGLTTVKTGRYIL